MKSLNKILCGVALATMVGGVGASLGLAKSETAKANGVYATDYSTVNVTSTINCLVAGYNGHDAPNEAYLVMSLSEYDCDVNLLNIPYTGDADHAVNYVASDYNFMDKISFSNDRKNWTTLRDMNGGSFYFSKGDLGGNLRFQLSALEGGDYKSSVTRFVKIEENCEFPSFKYATGASGEAKKYVQSKTQIFDSLAAVDNPGTDYKRNHYAISELTTIFEAVTSRYDDQNTSRLWLRTTNQDYYDYTGLSGNPLDNVVTIWPKDYNYFDNILLNGDKKLGDYTLLQENLPQIWMNACTRKNVSSILDNSKTIDIESITIPALTQLPSLTYQTTVDAGIKNRADQAGYEYGEPIIYCTEKDLVLNTKVPGAGHDQADANGDTWFHGVPVDATNVSFQNITEENPFIRIQVSETDYAGCNTTNILPADAYTLHTLQKTFVGDNILLDGDAMQINSFGESFANLFGEENSFAVRFKGSTGKINSNEITIKKGTMLPSKEFMTSGSTTEPRVYVVKNDTTFKRYGDKFAKINHREYDPEQTKEVSLEGIFLRPDATMTFIQIRIPDSFTNYANAPANEAGAFLPENELANLNFLNKLHLIKIDGSEVDLKMENIDSVRYNQWGNNALFIQLNRDAYPLSELQTVREIVLDPGVEMPDYDSNVKLVLSNGYTGRYVNGTKYEVDSKLALGFWNTTFDVTGPRDFSPINKVYKGEINVKPIGDGDSGLGSQRIWLQPEMDGDGKNIYTDINNNTDAVYSILFNTNMLGKIVLIKDGVETRMSELLYGDDCCTVNKWDRPRGTICIAPTLTEGFSYRNYDAIRLEAGLEIPAYGFQSTDASTELGYYVVPTTTTWYLNNKNSYGFQKTATFDETVLNTITGGTVSAPAVPAQDGYIGYWEDASNALFDPNHIVTDNEVYHSYQSEIKTVTPILLDGVRGDAGTSTNLTIKFDGVDYSETTSNVNVANFETFASHIELYDMEGNSLPVNTNSQRFIWSNGKLLIQLEDSQSEFLHKIYKVVLKAGATAPSLAFMTTGEGPTYTIDQDYSYVRFLGTDTWHLITEPTEEIDTKVTKMELGVNKLPAGSYNVILELDGYVGGEHKTSPKMLLDVVNNIHFYKADGSEMEISFNTEQHSSWTEKGVLFQIFAEEAPAKVVFDEGIEIPSPAYVEGEGAMLKLSEEAVLVKVGDVWQFVKEYTFDGESVYFTYGQTPDTTKVPTPGTKESSETTDYTGYWKDSEGNEFDPTAAVTKDMAFTTDFKESARKYNVNYVDENGEAVKTVQVANGSEYEVEAGLTKTGYTGYWTSEDVTIDEDGKFTMPTEDVTLKAAYTANSYTLTCGDKTVDVTFDSVIGELPEVTSPEGKHALGWYIGEEKLEETTVWTFAENKTAEAKYEDHVYEEWTNNGNGTHSSTCECGNVMTEDHVWGKGVVTTQPTHETEGVMTYTCTKCDATKTESIPVLTEHDYTNRYVDNEDGLTHESYCICGEHTTENHNWDEGVVTKAQSCTEDGVMTYTCADCKATKTEVIPANGHLWDQGVVTKEATCTEDGVMTYTCDTCHETKTEVIPATGHQLGELIAEVAATTEKEGMKAHYVCSVCGQYFDANKVACTQESLVIAKLPQPEPEPTPEKKGCGGSVVAASAVVTGLAIAGAALIASKKKHD